MSLLNAISKPDDRPPILTICSDAGLGKTTLAASFPKPIFLRSEDGVQAIPKENRPDSFPVINSEDDLWQQLRALIDEDHQYKTMVIDSATSLERLFIQSVIDRDPKKPKTIAQAIGGYGAGLLAVSSMHQRIRRAAGILNIKKNMNVVFVAHADTEHLELPDQDPYTRYSLRLGKKSVAPYVDDVDLVGFIKLETFTQGDGERKKAVSDGTRLIVTYAAASNVSKNRYGITKDIPFKMGENPLAEYLPLNK